MIPFKVDWNQLAQIKELKEYFEEDFTNFQQLIEEEVNRLSWLSQEDLDKIAELRVLEVTNGCTQWAFRRQDEQSLSVEQTRKCMKMVMGFIKEKELHFPSKGIITFKPEVKKFLEESRQIYLDAFKNNVAGAELKYYASSTAQFIVLGRARMEAAMELVKQDYEELFSPYYIQRGRNYIAPYLACISHL